MNICLNCGAETVNPKFCSKSCAATYNNKLYPKRKCSKVCNVCGDPVKHHRRRLCEFHHQERMSGFKYHNKTIGEYRNSPSVKNKHPSWVHSHIRLFVRSWLKHLTKEPCRHCGYDKHVELAHIQAVSSFPDSALLSEVNSETNVIPFCPNWHW